jgi:hypothetical protein
MERQRTSRYLRFYGHFSLGISKSTLPFRGCRAESVECLPGLEINNRVEVQRSNSVARGFVLSIDNTFR